MAIEDIIKRSRQAVNEVNMKLPTDQEIEELPEAEERKASAPKFDPSMFVDADLDEVDPVELAVVRNGAKAPSAKGAAAGQASRASSSWTGDGGWKYQHFPETAGNPAYIMATNPTTGNTVRVLPGSKSRSGEVLYDAIMAEREGLDGSKASPSAPKSAARKSWEGAGGWKYELHGDSGSEYIKATGPDGKTRTVRPSDKGGDGAYPYDAIMGEYAKKFGLPDDAPKAGDGTSSEAVASQPGGQGKPLDAQAKAMAMSGTPLKDIQKALISSGLTEAEVSQVFAQVKSLRESEAPSEQSPEEVAVQAALLKRGSSAGRSF